MTLVHYVVEAIQSFVVEILSELQAKDCYHNMWVEYNCPSECGPEKDVLTT